MSEMSDPKKQREAVLLAVYRLAGNSDKVSIDRLDVEFAKLGLSRSDDEFGALVRSGFIRNEIGFDIPDVDKHIFLTQEGKREAEALINAPGFFYRHRKSFGALAIALIAAAAAIIAALLRK
jgi:hypothetical protein